MKKAGAGTSARALCSKEQTEPKTGFVMKYYRWKTRNRLMIKLHWSPRSRVFCNLAARGSRTPRTRADRHLDGCAEGAGISLDQSDGQVRRKTATLRGEAAATCAYIADIREPPCAGRNRSTAREISAVAVLFAELHQRR
jgi:hypothetical protein